LKLQLIAINLNWQYNVSGVWYLSNHTHHKLGMQSFPPEFRSLEGDLRLNGDTPGGRKADVGERKVLRHHPRIKVGPLLKWDLKLLPGVVN
jgi:hypothetical protein